MPRLLSSGLVAVLGIAACGGSDATSPQPTDQQPTLTAREALNSLELGLSALGTSGSFGPDDRAFVPSLALANELVTTVDVQVDGATMHMFALVTDMVYPPLTCTEQVVDPLAPVVGGVCTIPSSVLTILLWQPSSETKPPDRMVVILADTGTAAFHGFSPHPILGPDPLHAFPAIATYAEGTQLWVGQTGTVTTTMTNLLGIKPCDLPKPSFSMGAFCRTTSFATTGSITLNALEPLMHGMSSRTITIPAQILKGAVQHITGITSELTGPSPWDY